MKKLNAFQMMACGSNLIKLTLSLFIVAMMSTGAYADCQLNCNQNVQVSLDGDCEATITYKTMLQDPDNPAICSPNGPSAYVVDVITADGTHLGDKISRATLKDGCCGVTYLVKVKHWATGNICWGSILVEDKIAPSGKAVDFEVLCYEGIPDAAKTYAKYANAYDNCDEVTMISHTTRALYAECNPELIAQGLCGKFERIYTVEDKCGNTAQFSHYISVRSVNPTRPDDVTVSCKDAGKTGPEYTGYPTIGGVDLDESGLVGYCKWAADYQDWVVDICPAAGSKEIIRTWKLANKCTGEVVKYEQKISVVNEGPWVDGLDEEDLWFGTNTGSHACEYMGPLPIPAYKQECAPIVAIHASVFYYDTNGHKHATPIATEVDVLNGGLVRLPEGKFTVEYTFFDECHATAFYDTDGAVYDATAPVAIADRETSIDLSPNVNGAPGNEDCNTFLHARDLDSGSYDNCRDVIMKIARLDGNGNIIGSFGDKVEFNVNDACSDHMVAFRVYEDHSATGKDQQLWSQVMVNVTVEDNVIALIAPADRKIKCSGDDDWNAADAFGQPTLVGCTASLVGTPVDNFQYARCGESVYTRTWTATNCKGHTETATQTVRVYYEGTLDFTCPADRDYNCGEGHTADNLTQDVTGKPTLISTGCAFGAISDPVDQVFRHEGEGEGCIKIRRSWDIIDWCEGGATIGFCHQTITITDKVRPVVSCTDAEVCITDGCEASFTIPAPTVDDCTSTTTSVEWSFVSKDGAVAAGGASIGQSVTFGPGVLTLKYVTRDACGNFGNAACSVTFKDCKDPTPFCRDIGTAIMNNGTITIWASDFLLYAEDNCDGNAQVESTVAMRLTGTTDAPSSSLTLTCGDLSFGGGFAGVQVDIIVTDWAGNSDFCTTSFQIQDNSDNCTDGAGGGDEASIVTNFNSEEGESVSDVSVNLTGGTMNQSQMTTSSGVAQFSNVPMHGSYEVSGQKNMNLLNGVSTYDVVLMTRHILGINKLDSPYKMIAADINNSGSISTGDVLALRRAILAITNDFGDNTSWRFVDASYTFPNPTNPFDAAFPEKLNVNDLDHDMNADFIGVKIGDLNGSATPNELLGSPSVDGAAMTIGLDDVQMTAGQTYEIEFKSKDFDQFGYQFTLAFDKNAVSVNEITPGTLEGLSQNNFGMQLLDQGAITTAWDNAEGIQLADNNTLFTLSVTANTNTTLSNVLNINSSVTAAEAVNSELEATDVQLEFFNKTSAQFELFQNTPNPFSGETLIEFSIPEADQVSFQVFDVSGRVLLERVQNMNAGTHQIRISKDDLGATGVLYYQVETSTDVATKKMITME